ncbi:hypothetical protein H4582DRAFT_1995048 [Lactarius indigo]|nr:hypothetical protein H4582DRAFT_1995048 [Lactarius indigo]
MHVALELSDIQTSIYLIYFCACSYVAPMCVRCQACASSSPPLRNIQKCANNGCPCAARVNIELEARSSKTGTKSKMVGLDRAMVIASIMVGCVAAMRGLLENA